MSLRADIIPLIDEVLEITGPDELDIRPSRLTIRTRTWSGGRVGDGTTEDSDLELPQKYRIREVTSREIATSGGRFEVGDVRVKVTPSDGAGTGYTTEQLAPTVEKGTEVIYILTGQLNGEYTRVELTSDRAFRRELVLRRTRRTP